MNKFFVKDEMMGELTIDRVLFESYYPILFTCKNEKEKHFVCVCSQNNKDGKKFLVAQVEFSDIIKMLKNELSVRELLVKCSKKRASVDMSSEVARIVYDSEDWKEDSIFLPKEDSYLDPDPGEFDDEIAYYQSEEQKKCYRSNSFNRISIINMQMKSDEKSWVSEAPYISATNEWVKTELNVILKDEMIYISSGNAIQTESVQKTLPKSKYSFVDSSLEKCSIKITINPVTVRLDIADTSLDVITVAA